MDPYINIDPGTMSPFQHGEVFVTEDGAETDLDLNLLRAFLRHSKWRNATTLPAGVFIQRWLKRTSRWLFGRYGTGYSTYYRWNQRRIRASGEGYDIAMIEIGGTVGDIESLPFMEAVRQIQVELVATMRCWCILTLVPYIASAGESKPNQPSTQSKELRSIGLQPDVLICRSEHAISDDNRLKIAIVYQCWATCRYPLPRCQIHLSNSKYPACPAFRWFDLWTLWVRYPRADLSDWHQFTKRC